jgi:exodeoxyribonuclease V gamma subunit
LLALYPSNKLEHLSFLLTTLIKHQPNGVFTPETILVESPGMQHWVSMQLAKEQGVAMNLDFPLPVRFMWNTARLVLGKDKVPKQSPYRREVLVWRIDALLLEASGLEVSGQEASLQSSAAFEQVNKYWLQAGSEQEQGVQRLQLATALADVYEQYLLYRPDWLFAWEESQRKSNDESEIWQSEIWRHLVKQEPLHPARLHQLTLTALNNGDHLKSGDSELPNRIVVFAINTMAPQLIAFFDALAAHIDIHIFHLNPSVNYWGDAKSDSELARQLRMDGLEKWMQQDQSNPLLGNLGQQGRELFNLLTDLETFEVSAFDAPIPADSETGETLLLNQIHNDILEALPAMPFASIQSTEADNTDNADDSVTIMCTHSALREVQVLHDHLLHWLSQDSSRTPSDVLVMCPAIENYAPFVDTVFHRVGTKPLGGNGPVRLPCSIADRSPMDAEPLIAAYMTLLHLPDSRFGVSDIVDYFQLDAVQKRFSIAQDDIDQMTVWLKQAHIHWGLNGSHKANVSSGATHENTYSWWWGIRRLLLGMLAPDSEGVIDDMLTIPDVEGQSTVTLGKLIHVIELLGRFATELNTPRSPNAWGADLLALRDTCFTPTKEQEHSWDLIAKVAADLSARCEEADYTYDLSLRQVRELLLSRFSSPDAGNHFMTGQVTVCSMLPMRSIPFKKVCILGLNDSEFPRKSTPLGLDLMAGPDRRVGDRSRRLEDRYLFLEAIISARESLYLSYQGNDVKNNSERQPSLVLGEFLDMLDTGYQVNIGHYLKHAPLHPFSESAFTGTLPSYETGWLRLAQSLRDAATGGRNIDTSEESSEESSKESSKEAGEQAHSLAPLAVDSSPENTSFQCMQVARAFSDPLAFFSQQRLGVNSEPCETTALVRYQVLDAMFSSSASFDDANAATLQHSDRVVQFATLRGDIPNNPVAQEELELWKESAVALTQAMGPHDAEPKRAQFAGKHFTFTASALEGGNSLMQPCAGKVNDIRALGYFMTQLVFSASDEVTPYTQYPLDIFYCDWVKGETKLMKRSFPSVDKTTAYQILLSIESLFVEILSAPTPVYSSLMSAVVSGTKKSPGTLLANKISLPTFLASLGGHDIEDIESVDIQGGVDTEDTDESCKSLIPDIRAFFASDDAQRILKNWLQSSGQFTADIASNPYVKWLFPDGVSWHDVPATHAFLLFALVANISSQEQL